MSTESRVKAIIKKHAPIASPEVESPVVDVPESEFFGIWRGSAASDIHERYLDLQMRGGERMAFDYPDRKYINYEPEKKLKDANGELEQPMITIDFGDLSVIVLGRNLIPIYELLLERKIKWIKEAD